ncbi:MAG: alkaline phosphatase D family protein [Rubricoccaceae bacterium]|nr:alkaline phosphatase D family protein [Rubricoccaceae bacterium]
MPLRSRHGLALLLALLALPAAAQENGPLHAGPMLGPVTPRDAVVWVQTDAPAEVQLRYYVEETADGTTPRVRPLTTAPIQTTPDGDHVALFRVADLEPGWTYGYQVLVDGEEVVLPYPTAFTTQPLWQWRTDPPAFTLALGSCYYANDPPYDRPGTPYGGSPAIFETIADLDPDLMLWLGDNVYLREVDWWSPAGIAYRYRHARAEPALQRLLATAHHYATWDDHDFGPNDSDRSYVLKGVTLEAFARYWPNPTHGIPGVPGVFTHFQFADAEFFLLDDRYHRTPNRAPAEPPHTILGEAQLQWLLDALSASRAPFKFVAMGGQVISPVAVFENYASVAPEERAFLLAEIERRGIEGVVFLSGDRHHSELMRLDRPDAYPLYEFTSSPLTAGVRAAPFEADNPIRVDGTLVAGQRSFGTITVEGPRTERVLTLRAHDPDGAVLWERRVEAAELRAPREE